MNTITIEMLENACADQQELFKATFKSGRAKLTPRNWSRAVAAGLDVTWLARLLNKAALAEYQRVTGPALAEYDRVTGPALAEYERVTGLAWAEYERVTGLAWAEYERVTGPALAEYQRVTGPALAEYQRVTGPALFVLLQDPKNWAEVEK